MEPNAKEYYTLKDAFSTIRAFRIFLFKRWWILLLSTILGVVAAFVYHDRQNPAYEAVCTFILEEKQAGAGGLSSIASQFGLDLGGAGAGGSIFTGDNILDILKSKKVVQKVLLSPSDDTSSNQSLVDIYIAYSGLKHKWRTNPRLAEVNFNNTNGNLIPVQDSILHTIHERIIKNNLNISRASKKGTIIKVAVTAPNAQFARLMTKRLVDEASEMYLNIKTGTALSSISRMQRRSDSLLMVLNNKSYVAATAQPLDINPGIRTAVVPMEIATRDKTVVAALYTEVTKNLEASKLLLSQQTPIIQVLDQPGILLPDNKKDLTLLVVIGILSSLVLCTIMLGIAFMLRVIKNSQ